MLALIGRITLTVLGAVLGVLMCWAFLGGVSTLSDNPSLHGLVTGMYSGSFWTYVQGTILIVVVHILDALSNNPRKLWYIFGTDLELAFPIWSCFALGVFAPYYVLVVTVVNYLRQVATRRTDF